MEVIDKVEYSVIEYLEKCRKLVDESESLTNLVVVTALRSQLQESLERLNREYKYGADLKTLSKYKRECDKLGLTLESKVDTQTALTRQRVHKCIVKMRADISNMSGVELSLLQSYTNLVQLEEKCRHICYSVTVEDKQQVDSIAKCLGVY